MVSGASGLLFKVILSFKIFEELDMTMSAFFFISLLTVVKYEAIE